MPLTIKSAVINYKDPDTGDYVEVNAVGDTAHVTDVKVNGTSVVTDNVADIPLATDRTHPGVVAAPSSSQRLTAGTGVHVSGGVLCLTSAADNNVKGGASSTMAIVPSNQHLATFYGLAKASGDTTQPASSNAVGTYTDEAKVAIQKMLGLYEAPWELIKEETFTNSESADYHITTDSNSSPFELSDVILHLSIPNQNNEASVGNYGLVNMRFGDGTYDYYQAELGAKTLAANSSAQYAFIKLEQSQKMRMLEFNKWTSSGNYTATCRQSASYNSVASAFSVYTNPAYVKDILIKSVLGTMTYRLYGKRKWE